MHELTRIDSWRNSMWLLLCEVFLPGDQEYDLEHALNDLVRNIEQFGFSQELQLRIKASILAAMTNAVSSAEQVWRSRPVLIQVFVEEDDPEKDESAEIIGGDVGSSGQAGPPSDAGQSRQDNQDAMRPILRGWGYFLVQKVVRISMPSTDRESYLLQIFIYKGGVTG